MRDGRMCFFSPNEWKGARSVAGEGRGAGTLVFIAARGENKRYETGRKKQYLMAG